MLARVEADGSVDNEPLLRLVRELGLVRSTVEAANSVSTNVAAVVGGCYSNLALLRENGLELVISHSGDLDTEIAGRYVRVPVDHSTPLGSAACSRRPVVLASLENYEVAYPHMIEDTRRAGIAATVSVPVINDRSELLGVIGVGWTPGSDVDIDGASKKLAHVSRICAEAIDRARQHGIEHEMVRALQRRMRVRLDTRQDRMEAAVRYRPASIPVAIGGDWDDVLSLTDRRTAVIVGDVVGRGVDAAAAMTELSAVLRTMTYLSGNAASALTAVSAAVPMIDESFAATAAVLIFDVEKQAVEYAVAGHPPPLLRHPDGRVERLVGARIPLLGIQSKPQLNATARFVPGSVLVAYTDGLVERRHEPVDAGIDRLAAVLRDVGEQDAEHICDGVLSQLATEALSDDVALVVLRHI